VQELKSSGGFDLTNISAEDITNGTKKNHFRSFMEIYFKIPNSKSSRSRRRKDCTTKRKWCKKIIIRMGTKTNETIFKSCN